MNFGKWIIMAGLVLSVFAKAGDHGPLPLSWYRLPEDGVIPQEDERATEERAADAIEHLLKANSRALDRLSEWETRHPEIQVSREDWKLSALMLDLSLSASGALGVLMAKGEASAQLYWRRLQDAMQMSESLGNEEADARFRGDDTREEIQLKLEPIIRTVMATQEVKNEA